MAKKSKVIKQKEYTTNTKIPKYMESPDSFYDKFPVWSFKMLDNDCVKWSISNVNDIYGTIIEKLRNYEGMKWSKIIQASGGRTHGNNNHFESISCLIPEAQKRWKELNLEEYDSVFSLRLSGRQRLYGILTDGTFKIVWFDPIHGIYKSR